MQVILFSNAASLRIGRVISVSMAVSANLINQTRSQGTRGATMAAMLPSCWLYGTESFPEDLGDGFPVFPMVFPTPRPLEGLEKY